MIIPVYVASAPGRGVGPLRPRRCSLSVGGRRAGHVCRPEGQARMCSGPVAVTHCWFTWRGARGIRHRKVPWLSWIKPWKELRAERGPLAFLVRNTARLSGLRVVLEKAHTDDLQSFGFCVRPYWPGTELFPGVSVEVRAPRYEHRDRYCINSKGCMRLQSCCCSWPFWSGSWCLSWSVWAFFRKWKVSWGDSCT